MRGDDTKQTCFISYVMTEERIPHDHPLREIKKIVDKALKKMNPLFSKLYSREGRPSIPPEHLFRGLTLQVLYTIRSERLLIEQLDYNLLFRWFIGLEMDSLVWDSSTFSKNRERLLKNNLIQAFLKEVLAEAEERGLLSNEHFSVDGTLIESWASHKSFNKKDGSTNPPESGSRNPSVDFHGEKRSNETHQSTTDPDARMYRKSPGQTAKLSYMGHALMDNRHGLIAAGSVSIASGKAETETALNLLKKKQNRNKKKQRITCGADKAYDNRSFVACARELLVTPHVAQNDTNRSSRIDKRTTRHPGYGISMTKRKLVEESFGWMKTIGLMRKTRHKGLDRVNWMFIFTASIYNLVRIRNLTEKMA
jgi:transposase